MKYLLPLLLLVGCASGPRPFVKDNHTDWPGIEEATMTVNAVVNCKIDYLLMQTIIKKAQLSQAIVDRNSNQIVELNATVKYLTRALNRCMNERQDNSNTQ